MFKKICTVIIFTVVLSSCVNPQYAKIAQNSNSINFIPMYGEPDTKKTENQKRSDEKFIKSVVKNSGSHEKAAKEFAAWGWAEKGKGNEKTAISRFNQSWLIDPTYYQPYWGFGAVALAKGNSEKAIIYFEKALNLINEDKEKPRLQVDTARAYAWQAIKIKKNDAERSKKYYKRANSLINNALDLDPKYKSAYSMGSFIYYEQGDYKGAWRIVKKSRENGNYKFEANFIEKLSKEMAEP